ncbi:hypothetical protein FRC11_000156 [Ceratobasidium sp. 423]|nr:hypothetical protein FRC11_000156 [Ceratobasidium sp. 423]
MASLSVLRISGVLFDWNEISPSRLVEFHVSRIAISGVPAIDSFLNLLASLPELRHLELIGVRVISYMDPDQSADIRVSFPKLKSLYLEDLYPGVMALFLTSIAPGSYRVTVNLSNTSIWKHQTADIFLVNTDEMYDSAHADVASMCNSLAPFPIDQLILGIHPPTWTTKFGLHTLLKSVPKLKSLVLNNFELHNEFVEALLPPPASEGNEGEILFPRFETVEFRSAVLIDRLERLKDVIAHHPVQCLVLGGVVRVLDVGVGDSPLEGGEEIVQWLKARVPGFRLIQGRVHTADSTDMGWQLWDI